MITFGTIFGTGFHGDLTLLFKCHLYLLVVIRVRMILCIYTTTMAGRCQRCIEIKLETNCTCMFELSFIHLPCFLVVVV